MKVEVLAKIVEEMVPTLLQKKTDSVEWGTEVTINFEGNNIDYITYKASFNFGVLGQLKNYIEEKAKDYLTISINSPILEKDWVCKDIGTKWLELNSSIKKEEWISIIEYCEEQINRTYENMPVSWNFIIDSKLTVTSSVSLKDSGDVKLLDVLAASNFTYFLVDEKLNIDSYSCINWDETTNSKSYSSVPNFLQPYWNRVDQGKIGVSITRAGDIIIYSNPKGMLLSIRKGRWTIYENASVKNMFGWCLKCADSMSYWVGCNIFDAVWDLSYRRHGALIIVSDDDSYEKHIINKNSIFVSSVCTGIRKALKSSFELVDMNKLDKKSIFLELASVDGAVVVDKLTGKIKSFGSIVETHANAGEGNGARTTAAKSAIWHGHMYPVKVSSDGDITLYVIIKIK